MSTNPRDEYCDRNAARLGSRDRALMTWDWAWHSALVAESLRGGGKPCPNLLELVVAEAHERLRDVEEGRRPVPYVDLTHHFGYRRLAKKDKNARAKGFG